MVVKFLLIDISALLLVVAFLLLFKRRNSQISLFKLMSNDTTLDAESVFLPDLNELLDLEKHARKNGSSIEFDSLIGLWKFLSVWKQDSDKENVLASSLLRIFSASLELRKESFKEDQVKFRIVNSIQFGSLLIRFIGTGELKGSQPLLPFFFELIELKLGDSVLFKRALEIPDEKNRPFFALIAMGDGGSWLSARGRGGGLALWLKD